MKKLSKINENTFVDIIKKDKEDYIKRENVITLSKMKNGLGSDIEHFIKTFVSEVVYKDRENTFDSLMEFLKSGSYSRSYYFMKEHSDIIIPYFKNNWNDFDNVEKMISDLVSEEEDKISKLGFKKVPGKSIDDTLYGWWDSLDEDTKYNILIDDLFQYAEERFWLNHSGGNFEYTGENLEADEEWDKASYLIQIKIYMKYNKINENTFVDIIKKDREDYVKKEDIMEDLFTTIKNYYKSSGIHYEIEYNSLKGYISVSLYKYICYVSSAELREKSIKFSTINPNKYKNEEILLVKNKSQLNDFYAKIKEMYSVKTKEVSGTDHWYIMDIKPKDGSDVTKKFCIEFMDFILENVKNYITKDIVIYQEKIN